MKTTLKTLIALTSVICLTIFATPNITYAQTMTIAPFKIVLNQQGNTESVQAVVPMTLESGYLFSSCEATLYIGGVMIAENYDAKYCYIDDNLLIYFDRVGVIGDEALADMANTIQTATVEGTLMMVNTDGDMISRGFSAYDDVEIVDPEKTVNK
ncbi:MAG: hypothetical protein AB1483_11555 [Candidatus Zixiibacteriota bacterium]